MMRGGTRADRGRITTVLCDADGTLFPSEEPAFSASITVTNEFLRSLGVPHAQTAEQLRRSTTGLTFRSTAARLARQRGVGVELDGPEHQDASGRLTWPTLTAADLERWVKLEKEVVTAHLEEVLQPDPAVHKALDNLAKSFQLAVVTSSASSRLDACLRVTGLAGFFPSHHRFSAEDSLARPTSKPDPAVYVHALDQLALHAHEAVAIEDSVAGATAAVASGVATYANVAFTPVRERRQRIRELLAVGAVSAASSWDALDKQLSMLNACTRPVRTTEHARSG